MKQYLSALIISTCCAFSAQAEQEFTIQPLVVGGNDAPQAYPWMVQLFLNGNYRCGGVQVADEWVLTAAHCTYAGSQSELHFPSSSLSVAIGEYQTLDSAPASALQIDQVIQHPDYSPNSIGDAVSDDYDLSLLRLAEPNPLASYPSISGVPALQAYSPGLNLTVIGHGRVNTNPALPEYPEVLQQGSVALISDASCAQSWDSSMLTDRMFCAQSNLVDACAGDSGGPIFIDEGGSARLLGLVSWGSNTCQGSPGVYADLGTMCGWAANMATLAGTGTITCTDSAGNESGGGSTTTWFALLLAGLSWLRWRSK